MNGIDFELEALDNARREAQIKRQHAQQVAALEARIARLEVALLDLAAAVGREAHLLARENIRPGSTCG